MIEIVALHHSGKSTYRLRQATNSKAFYNYSWSVHPQNSVVSNPMALDLLEIGKAVHLADRAIRRDLRLGKRTRAIQVCIPVFERNFWESVRGLLEKLAGFASCDVWQITFAQTKGREPPPRKKSSRLEADVVALFSGGLDSLCGAAYLCPRSTPVFVTHSPPGRERTEQMLAKLWAAMGKEPLKREHLVTFRLTPRDLDRKGRRTMFPEASRRTRPFFFLSLAAAVALEHQIEKIQMSENGAMALSLPLRAEAYGAQRARQAHDFLMRGFTELLKKIESRPWQVRNPFALETKGEACRHLKIGQAQPKTGLVGELASKTESCEYVGRQRARLLAWKRNHRRRSGEIGVGGGPQCGLCEPCVSRRAALGIANINEPESGYFFSLDVVRRLGYTPGGGQDAIPPLYKVVAPHVFWMRRFCRRLEATNQYDFAIDFAPEILKSGCVLDHMAVKEQYDLMRRYCQEISTLLGAEQS